MSEYQLRPSPSGGGVDAEAERGRRHAPVMAEEAVRFLAQEVSQNTYLNLMAQYNPCHKALAIPELARLITNREFESAVDLAHKYSLYRLDRSCFSLWLIK